MRSASSRLVIFLAAVALVAGCGNPRQEAATAQALNDAATEISGLRNDVAGLNESLDSVRTVLAKQDTLIQRIIAVAGIPK